MPKSRNRRKGKNRPRRQGAAPTFVEVVGGRPVRFAARLPPEAHPDQLDEKHGDDVRAKLFAFVSAGVAAADQDRFESILADLALPEVQDLGVRLAARYSVQTPFERVTGLTAHDMPPT